VADAVGARLAREISAGVRADLRARNYGRRRNQPDALLLPRPQDV